MAKKMTAEDYIVDFSKEEQGGGGNPKLKPGLYRVKIVSAKLVTSSEKGTPGLEVKFAFLDGRYRAKKTRMTERLWVTPKAYSRFRTLCEAVGVKVPKKLDLKKLIPKIKGKDLCIEVETEAGRDGYKDKSVVTFDGFLNLDDYEEDEDDDAEDEDEEDEDDDEEDDEEDEDDDEDDDDDDEDDEDDDEDDDEEEEEEVKPKKKAKKKAAAKKSKKKAKDDDEDDDDEIDLDEL